MTPAIVIVIPYFGEWDEYVPLFFETVRRNATIKFLVYTDCAMDGLEAPNITVTHLKMADYLTLVNYRTGVDFEPVTAYKLCDLRPLFGLIHEPEFRGFDFYGWCDVDLLLGDIRAFYSDQLLGRYDVFSTHGHGVSGHFALFRNIRRNRLMYRSIYHWREALRKREFVGIDEHGLTNAYVMTPVDRLNEKFGFAIDNSASRALARWRSRGLYFHEEYTTPFVSRPWLDGSRGSAQPDVWHYRAGCVANSRDGERKFPYLHLMNFRSSRWRHDGTPAPWERLERYCFATPADLTCGVRIDASGIHPVAGGGDDE